MRHFMKDSLGRTEKFGNLTGVTEFQYPDENEIKRLNGLVISGATCDCYDANLPFNPKLYEFIQEMYHKHTHIKILGVCYGHQVIAHCLGGKAQRIPELNIPFISAIEDIKVTQELKEKSYFKTAFPEGFESIYGIETHGDHIEVLPPKGELLGTSSSTKVEIW
eukprot:CAMPEP_0114597076 /NCGR_PEP_ID=MMETSP0125-20121206/19308_1 /TAXON_ID=485358 ORGANISM="Aristerostoma sp., Strain ATCC 50986" /NCGR_SAMPLE_ID=MMETSP0125 /ASSEMBLY_ACC=CAM_ASM_000245 /LENGTH=163 /DNA_ID=CAMNT_0001801169 /DNA_START=510 /DNA_END=997 /DNA_ORIENTATION=+